MVRKRVPISDYDRERQGQREHVTEYTQLRDVNARGSAPPSFSALRRRTTAGDYLSEKINYGGEVWTRGDVIADLQGQGADQRRIDAYMTGAQTLSESMARILPRKGTFRWHEARNPKTLEVVGTYGEIPFETGEGVAIRQAHTGTRYGEYEREGKIASVVNQPVRIRDTQTLRELASAIGRWHANESMDVQEALHQPTFVAGSVADQLAVVSQRYPNGPEFSPDTRYAVFNIDGKSYAAYMNKDGSFSIKILRGVY